MTHEPTDELTRLYRALDDEIARLGWRCRACGRCCRFAEYGHEVFCSEIEAAYLAAGAELPEWVDDAACPFLLADGGCGRHDRRTLACRTYFCDAERGAEMALLSEAWLARLKRLHERLGLPWHYARLTSHLNRRNT